MKRDWKVKYLPFLYRECPMGNAHWVGNHICYCCEGQKRNWTYVWKGEKGWIPVDFALDTTYNHSSLSWSGQMTTGELFWNGIRLGLLIALVLGLFAFLGFKAIQNETQKYQKNVQSNHERTQDSME